MLVTNNTSNEFLLGRGLVLTPFGVLLVPDESYLHDDYVRRSVNALLGSGDGTISDVPDWFPIEDAGGVKLTVSLNSLMGASGPTGAPGDQGPTGVPGPSGPGLYWIWRRKLADELLALSILLHDDDTLHFSSGIGDFWHLEAYIVYEAHTTGDIKLSLVGPVGTIGCWSVHPQTLAGGGMTASDRHLLGEPQVAAGAGVGVGQAALLKGYVNTVVAGEVGVQWAQNTSHATPTIVKAGSYLLARRVEYA